MHQSTQWLNRKNPKSKQKQRWKLSEEISQGIKCSGREWKDRFSTQSKQQLDMMMARRQQNPQQTTLDRQQQPTTRVTGRDSTVLSFQYCWLKIGLFSFNSRVYFSCTVLFHQEDFLPLQQLHLLGTHVHNGRKESERSAAKPRSPSGKGVQLSNIWKSHKQTPSVQLCRNLFSLLFSCMASCSCVYKSLVMFKIAHRCSFFSLSFSNTTYLKSKPAKVLICKPG